MKKTNPIFSLKNFRSFGEEGADFELAPITVLTGCNSGGKSSLVKALMLLSEQTTGQKVNKGMIDDKRYQPSTILKTSSAELKLGGFSNVINEQAKNGILTISYRIWSEYLQEEVICSRTYRKKKGVLDEGGLFAFTIEKATGEVIYKAMPDTYLECLNFGGEYEEVEVECMDEEGEFAVIEDNYRRFVQICLYVDLNDRINNLQRLSKKTEESKREIVELKQQLKEIRKLVGKDSPDAYDEKIVTEWNSRRWQVLFNSSAIERNYIKNRTEEEREKDNKELFTTRVINEVITPWFLGSQVFIDSATNEIQRVYNVEKQDKFSKLLNTLIQTKPSTTYKTGSFVNKWLERFDIGNSIEIVGTDEGLGVKVYLEKNGKKRILADEGYGITQLISMLLQVELVIKMNKHYDELNDKFYNLKHVICVEEPEVHLHPKYQSMLAEMFVEAYQDHNTHFIIETHSEYLIRKLQVIVADSHNEFSANDVSLNYVEKGADGLSTNRKIGLNEDGTLKDAFGEGFFDEAGGLSRELLRLSK